MSPAGMDDPHSSLLERDFPGESFGSAEARYEYEKAVRLRRVLKWTGAALALVVFGMVMYRLGGGRFGAASGSETGQPARGKLDVQPVGSPDAKVRVMAVLPAGSDCHNSVVKFLTEIATKRQDKIRVEFASMETYGTGKLEQQIGTSCAAIMINGMATFEVESCGQKRTISLVGTEPTHYSLADVGEALTSVYMHVYGDPGEPLYTAPAGSRTCSGPGEHGGHGPVGMSPKPGVKAPGEETQPIELPAFREIQTVP